MTCEGAHEPEALPCTDLQKAASKWVAVGGREAFGRGQSTYLSRQDFILIFFASKALRVCGGASSCYACVVVMWDKYRFERDPLTQQLWQRYDTGKSR